MVVHNDQTGVHVHWSEWYRRDRIKTAPLTPIQIFWRSEVINFENPLECLKKVKKNRARLFFLKIFSNVWKKWKKSGEVIFFEIVSKKSQKFSALRAKTYWFCLKIWSKIPKIFRRFAPDPISHFFHFFCSAGLFFLKSCSNLQKNSREVINFENFLQFDNFLRFWKKYEIRGYS